MARSVLVFVSDLIFSTRITAAARDVGVPAKVVRRLDDLAAQLGTGQHDLLLVDLNAEGDPLAAIEAARQATEPPRIMAYVSHVEVELAEAARRIGADLVLPRSAFVARLCELLQTPPVTATVHRPNH